MRFYSSKSRGTARLVAAFLAGTTLFGGCQAIFKNAVVGGTENFVFFTLLDPARVLDQLGLVPGTTN